MKPTIRLVFLAAMLMASCAPVSDDELAELEAEAEADEPVIESSQHALNTQFPGCTALEAGNLVARLNESIELVRSAWVAWQQNPTNPAAVKWFGTAANSSWTNLVLGVTALGATEPANVWKIHCATTTPGPEYSDLCHSAYAFTNLGSYNAPEKEIWVCPGFWNFDSVWKDLTLTHEFTHLWASTSDYTAGSVGALELARDHPTQAALCAENYGYFYVNQYLNF